MLSVIYCIVIVGGFWYFCPLSVLDELHFSCIKLWFGACVRFGPIYEGLANLTPLILVFNFLYSGSSNINQS